MDTCEVERIIGRRICIARRTEYLVFWKGYGLNECQWVAKADLQCDHAVAQFERRCFDLRKARRLNAAIPPIDRFENEGVATLVDAAQEIYDQGASPFDDVMDDFSFVGSGKGPVEPPLAPGGQQARGGTKRRLWQVATHGWSRQPDQASDARITKVRGVISNPSGGVFYLAEWSDGTATWERPGAFDSALAVVRDYENQRYAREHKELIKLYQRSKFTADMSIVLPREPKCMLEKSPVHASPQPALRTADAELLPNERSRKAITRGLPTPATSSRGWFNIGTSKLLGVDAPPATFIPSIPATGESADVECDAESDAGSDASSDSNSSACPLIKSTLSNRALEPRRVSAIRQSYDSELSDSDVPLAQMVLGDFAAAGSSYASYKQHGSALEAPTPPAQTTTQRAPGKMVAYVYIDHEEGQFAKQWARRTRQKKDSVSDSPEIDRPMPPSGDSIDANSSRSNSRQESVVMSASRKCGYCSIDASIPMHGDARSLQCTGCKLIYHGACYQKLAERFGEGYDLADASSGDVVCIFCLKYSGRAVDVCLTWRTSAAGGARHARMAQTVQNQVDVIVKWKNVSYRHLDWVPMVWLSAMWRSPLLRNMKAQIQGGFTPPSLESRVDSNYLIPAQIIGARNAQASTASKRRRHLEDATTSVPEYKWVLYTKYESVWVVWQGLDVSDATWEEPPDPLGDAGDYVLWYDAFVAWRRAELVSLNRHRSLASRQPRGGLLIDNKQQPSFVKGGLLKDYQLEGANWLWQRWKVGKAAILADEMGMGKTIQVIAFLLMVYHSTIPAGLSGDDATKSNTGVFPFLVVVPTTLVENWAREFRTWAPNLVVAQLSGRAASREVQLGHTLFRTPRSGKRDLRCHVVLTSYEAVSGTAGSDALLSAGIQWQAVIVDEGHRLKNDHSKTHQALLRFKTRQRVVLTGTPLQNHMRELFCIMSFIDHPFFGSADSLEGRFGSNSSADIEAVKNMLRPYILRRTKNDQPCLVPPKFEVILPVSMTPLQRELYKATLARNVPLLRKISAALHTNDGQLAGGLETPTDSEPSTGRSTRLRAEPADAAAPRPKKPVMLSLNNLLMEVRRIVSHPYLIRSVEPEFPSATEKHQRLIDSSGKLALVHQLLPELKARGHRVLIFAQFKGTLDILEDYLDGEHIGYERIDGDTPSHMRQARVSAFNAADSPALVFLSSTRTGGLGLNLTSADTVIIYDCDFNPQVDIQAMARAHRIGQTKPVSVFKLVTNDSAEERIVAIATRKLILDHLVIQSMDSPAVLADEGAQPGEMEQALRHGASMLFEADAEESAERRAIKYDRARIVTLLDEFKRELDLEMKRAEDTVKQRTDPSKSQASDFARVWTLDKTGGVSEIEVDSAADSVGGDEGDADVWTRLLEHAVGDTGLGAGIGAVELASEEVGGRTLRMRKRRVDYKDSGPSTKSPLREDGDGDFVDAGGEDIDFADDGIDTAYGEEEVSTAAVSTAPAVSPLPRILLVSQTDLRSIVATHTLRLVAYYQESAKNVQPLTAEQDRLLLDRFGELVSLRTLPKDGNTDFGPPGFYFPMPYNMRLRQGSQLPAQPCKGNCRICSNINHERTFCPFICDVRFVNIVNEIRQIGNYWCHPHFHNFVTWYTAQYVWFVLSHPHGDQINAENGKRFPGYAVDVKTYLLDIHNARAEKDWEHRKKLKLNALPRAQQALDADCQSAAFSSIFVDDSSNGGGMAADELFAPDAPKVRATHNLMLSATTGNGYFNFFAILGDSCKMAALGSERSSSEIWSTLTKLYLLRNDTLELGRRLIRERLSMPQHYLQFGGQYAGLVSPPNTSNVQPRYSDTPPLAVSTVQAMTFDFVCLLCNIPGHQPSRCPNQCDIGKLTERRVAVNSNQGLPPGIKEITLAVIDQYLQLCYKSLYG
ncbi:hypothetical protein LPJ61_002143 [Coemansia biformis]|uniref:Uncharacterized protein n=1 Tax=Coemansia biformis TaxID=1286918 RepID=A0A9W7YF33_9FUNG|nr:hypothetical protein LPJ61_002143 [Coemansia biformis]